MGWVFSERWPRRKDLIRDRTKDETWKRDGASFERRCLAHTYRGAPFAGVLYSVHELTRTQPDGTEKKSRYIIIDLLRWHAADFGGCWGYKDMDETMGPYYYGCPLKYLDMVPCSNYETARKWREKVREYWKIRAERRREKKAVAG